MPHNHFLVKKSIEKLTNAIGVNLRGQNCTIEIWGAKIKQLYNLEVKIIKLKLQEPKLHNSKTWGQNCILKQTK
jgi:hypothetical protein